MHLAEVVPAGGAAVTVEALTGLLLLCGLIVALGMIKFVVAIVDALLYVIHKVVHRVPIIGPSFNALAKRAAAKITNALAHAELAVDEAIGWTWHNMAHLIRWTVHEIEALSYALLVNAIATSLHISRKHATQLIQAFVHPIRAYQHILRRLHQLEHAALHALRHIVLDGVYPRIHAGEAALDRVIEWDIPRLRARERVLGREITNLRRWVRAHARPIATAAFVAATAVAVRRLGMNWVRCRNWKRIGKAVCGLPPSRIDGLLALLVGGLALTDYRELVREMQKVERAAAEELVDLLHAFDK